MAKWKLEPRMRRFPGDPGPDGRDCSHGANVYLRSETRRRKIAVWYARGAHESALRPREAVREYLDLDDPPTAVLVTTTGVSVIEAQETS